MSMFDLLHDKYDSTIPRNIRNCFENLISKSYLRVQKHRQVLANKFVSFRTRKMYRQVQANKRNFLNGLLHCVCALYIYFDTITQHLSIQSQQCNQTILTQERNFSALNLLLFIINKGKIFY